MAADKKHTFIHTWGKKGNMDGEFHYPTDIVMAHDGTIYVSDCGNYRIQRFDCNGTFLHKWGSQGRGDGEFQWTRGLAIGICNGMNASIMNAMQSVSELNAFPPGVLPICVAY